MKSVRTPPLARATESERDTLQNAAIQVNALIKTPPCMLFDRLAPGIVGL